MGYVSNSWSLVMCLVMISAAVIVRCNAKWEVGSMDKRYPEPREERINELQHSERSGMELRHDQECPVQAGRYTITIDMGDWNWGGTSDRIDVQVNFTSGRTWGDFRYLDNNFWRNTVRRFDKYMNYYGERDRVDGISVRNNGADAIRFRSIHIDTPGYCGTYRCDLWPKCENKIFDSDGRLVRIDFSACYIEEATAFVKCALHRPCEM